MTEAKMGLRQYSKFDKTFMLFGSMMNGSQQALAQMHSQEQLEKTIKDLWQLAKTLTSEYVDEMYTGADIATEAKGRKTVNIDKGLDFGDV